MGRPPKADADSRTVFVGVRLTADERATLERAATAAGVPVSAYLRQAALSGPVAISPRRSLEWPVLDQLRRIGVNLNQAVRVANAQGRIPPELARAAAAVEAFLMREIVGGGWGDGPEGRG